MNLQRLKEAEASFLAEYPNGFDDEGLSHIKKSHNVDRLADYAKQNLTRTVFKQPNKLADVVLTIVSRSSMVSRFEKPPFRDFIASLNTSDKTYLANAMEKRLYGRNKQQGFEEFCDLLAAHKLARWSVISAVPFYFAPKKEVFVKPTTAKKLVAYLEAQDLHYHARPDWAFYRGYQALIKDVSKNVATSLSPNNAAVTGFLMTQT